jgi:hypothetical protein
MTDGTLVNAPCIDILDEDLLSGQNRQASQTLR